jgi:predicted O-methyltransferase YrrM
LPTSSPSGSGYAARIIDQLFPVNPYRDFDPTSLPLDLQSWGADDGVLAEAARAVSARLVVEVGTWKGASAVRLAKLLPDDGALICIDTWLGTANNFLGTDHLNQKDSLARRNGYPQIYYQFLANVMQLGLSDKVVPLPQTSMNGAKILGRLGLRPDLVYIDASHELMDVYLDIVSFYAVLREGGILVGDDLQAPEVAAAVRKFCADQRIQALARGNKYVLFKGTSYPLPGYVAL